MSRTIVLGVVGFLLGIGGATGIVVAREREADGEALARVAADSAAIPAVHAAAPADSSTPAAAFGPDSVQLPALPAHAATPADSAARADSAVVALATRHGAAPDSAYPAADPAADSGAAHTATANTARSAPIPDRKLAKIFAAMPPREAAKVLEQMDDNDVQIVLGFLGDRQAAGILSSLPVERAAAISRASIRGGGGQ